MLTPRLHSLKFASLAKFKSIIPLAFLLLAASELGCKKNCETTNPVCKETAPTNELCQAAFNRWFYDATTNACQQIAYSGCSAKGFATQAECEACKCS